MLRALLGLAALLLLALLLVVAPAAAAAAHLLPANKAPARKSELKRCLLPGRWAAVAGLLQGPVHLREHMPL